MRTVHALGSRLEHGNVNSRFQHYLVLSSNLHLAKAPTRIPGVLSGWVAAQTRSIWLLLPRRRRPPPLRRTREQRGAAAPAHRRARSTASLDDELLGALEKAAAGAGCEASQDRGGCSAGSIIDWLAHCASVTRGRWRQSPRRLPHRGGAAAATSVPPKTLAAVACVRLSGHRSVEWTFARVWT